MKKILQRIGLLAMAVMLLWGWQGMEAKAAVTDDTINWLRQGVNLSEWDFTYNPDHHYTLSYGMGVGYGTGCNTPYQDNHYVIYIEPEDGYCFADKPTVNDNG